MFSALRKTPGELWLLVLGQALCFTISAVVSYVGSKETVRTDVIMESLKRLHLGPIAFHGAFYFNLGQQLYNVIVFTVYILARKNIVQRFFHQLRLM
jgi:hypothetical protein